MRPSLALAAFAIAAVPAAASAQSNVYVFGNIGVNSMPSFDTDFTDTTLGRGMIETETSIGYRLGFGAGYQLNDFRVEGAAYFTENSVDTITVTQGNTTQSAGISGDVETAAFMINAWYDIDLGSSFTPYVGAGIGYGLVDPFDDAFSTFAWQIGAGVSYDVSPQVAITGDYRYSVLTGFEETIGSTTFDFDGIASHAFLIGVRYAF